MNRAVAKKSIEYKSSTTSVVARDVSPKKIEVHYTVDNTSAIVTRNVKKVDSASLATFARNVDKTSPFSSKSPFGKPPNIFDTFASTLNHDVGESKNIDKCHGLNESSTPKRNRESFRLRRQQSRNVHDDESPPRKVQKRREIVDELNLDIQPIVVADVLEDLNLPQTTYDFNNFSNEEMQIYNNCETPTFSVKPSNPAEFVLIRKEDLDKLVTKKDLQEAFKKLSDDLIDRMQRIETNRADSTCNFEKKQALDVERIINEIKKQYEKPKASDVSGDTNDILYCNLYSSDVLHNIEALMKTHNALIQRKLTNRLLKEGQTFVVHGVDFTKDVERLYFLYGVTPARFVRELTWQIFGFRNIRWWKFTTEAKAFAMRVKRVERGSIWNKCPALVKIWFEILYRYYDVLIGPLEQYRLQKEFATTNSKPTDKDKKQFQDKLNSQLINHRDKLIDHFMKCVNQSALDCRRYKRRPQNVWYWHLVENGYKPVPNWTWKDDVVTKEYVALRKDRQQEKVTKREFFEAYLDEGPSTMLNKIRRFQKDEYFRISKQDRAEFDSDNEKEDDSVKPMKKFWRKASAIVSPGLDDDSDVVDNDRVESDEEEKFDTGRNTGAENVDNLFSEIAENKCEQSDYPDNIDCRNEQEYQLDLRSPLDEDEESGSL